MPLRRALRSARMLVSTGSKLEVSVGCLSGGTYGASLRRRLGPKSKFLKNEWALIPVEPRRLSAPVHNLNIRSCASKLSSHSIGIFRVCFQLMTFDWVPRAVSSRKGGCPTSIS